MCQDVGGGDDLDTTLLYLGSSGCDASTSGSKVFQV